MQNQSLVKQSQTSGPTITSTITPTITVTPSPLPSDTPTPTIEPPNQLSKILKNVDIEAYDPFDTLNLNLWDMSKSECIQVIYGVLEYTCSAGIIGWHESFLTEGQGILLDIKYLPSKDNYYIGFSLSEKGVQWGDPKWKRFGIDLYGESGQNKQSIAVMKGGKWLGQSANWLRPNIWYRIMMAMKTEGTFLLSIWERDKPNASPLKYQRTMKEWSGLKWGFWMNSDFPTTIYWDNYYTISFSE